MTLDITLGSAEWLLAPGYQLQDLYRDGQKILFGRDEKNPLEYIALAPRRHFLTIAATRSGKGTQLIIPNLLLYNGSAIVIDPKGENAYITAKERRNKGQKTYILDPWNEVNRRYGSMTGELEEVATFNPLSRLNPASENFADDVNYISDALIISQSKDPHFDDSARELVAGLIAFAAMKYGEAASLPLVRLLLSKSVEEIAGIAEEARQMGGDTLAARKLSRFCAPTKELASVISTAQTQTAFLDSKALENSLHESSFSFSDLTEGKATIYLVLPVDKLQTYGRWLRLMISIGIKTVARCTVRLPSPVLFILDEFGTIGKLSAVAQAVGLMAGLNMCIWAFIQDLTQLKRDYPNDWESFISNSEAVSSFDAMDQTTTEYVSKLLGRATIVREFFNKSGGTSSNGEKASHNSGWSTSTQVFARDLLTPDEVRRLGQRLGLDLAIGISREGNWFVQRVSYYENPLLSVLARENPLFKVGKEAAATPFFRKRDEESAKPEEEEKESYLDGGFVSALAVVVVFGVGARVFLQDGFSAFYSGELDFAGPLEILAPWFKLCIFSAIVGGYSFHRIKWAGKWFFFVPAFFLLAPPVFGLVVHFINFDLSIAARQQAEFLEAPSLMDYFRALKVFSSSSVYMAMIKAALPVYACSVAAAVAGFFFFPFFARSFSNIIDRHEITRPKQETAKTSR